MQRMKNALDFDNVFPSGLDLNAFSNKNGLAKRGSYLSSNVQGCAKPRPDWKKHAFRDRTGPVWKKHAFRNRTGPERIYFQVFGDIFKKSNF